MADTVTIKKITDLPENTDANDADLFMQGANGTASLRKIKWSTILAKIKSKLLANNLTTTQEGYALDARQGKALSDQINTLNTNSSGARAYRVFFQAQAGWLVSTDIYFPDASGNTRSITSGTIVGEGSLSSDQITALNSFANKSSRIWTWQTTNSAIATALAGKIVALTIS